MQSPGDENIEDKSLANFPEQRPFPVDTSMNACAEPASEEARIITPTFVQTCVPSIETTRATIEPSPDSERYA